MKQGNTVMNHDGNQPRISFFLQQCAEMDAMPMEKRQEALSFAKAMTALEGLPAREKRNKTSCCGQEVKSNLQISTWNCCNLTP